MPKKYPMPIIKVKVIKVNGPCEAGHKVGDTWKFPLTKCPKGLCTWALTSIFPYIAIIGYGGRLPWEKKKKYAVANCSDSDNTVTFEITVEK